MATEPPVAAATVEGARVIVVRGDLTAQGVDVVVNAANEQLQHGGGVAAAIVRAGGPTIQDASSRWVSEHGPVARGTAAVTGAGHLPARFVVHTVGPRFSGDGSDEEALREAVDAALEAAASTGARSIAFPAISAGVYGYPQEEATTVIAAAVVDWLRSAPGMVDEIRLVGFDEGTAADFAAGLRLATV